MSKQSKIIYVDVDGVLTNPTAEFLSVLNEKVKKDYTLDDLTAFDYRECLPEEHAEIMMELWGDRYLYDKREAEPEAVRALQEMRKFARVIALSSPTIGHVDSKYKWLVGPMDFEIKDVIVATDKSLARGDVLVDDHIENLMGFSGGRICFTRPWNAKWDTKLGIRTDDWEKIVVEAKRLISK